MNNEKQLTTEELKELSIITSQFDEVTIRYGDIKLKRKFLDKEESSVDAEFNAIDNTSNKFHTRLVEKYGNGFINPQTQTFILS